MNETNGGGDDERPRKSEETAKRLTDERARRIINGVPYGRRSCPCGRMDGRRGEGTAGKSAHAVLAAAAERCAFRDERYMCVTGANKWEKAAGGENNAVTILLPR